MGDIITVLLIGLLLWGALAFGARMNSGQKSLLGAAIMVGITGYLLVGNPGLPGSTVANPEATGFGEKLEKPLKGMASSTGGASQWLAMSDGFMRSGHPYLAAQALAEAVRRYPDKVDLWVAYGNAMVAHSGGIMTPAAAMAFDRAGAIDPTHPAPPFFAGLAMAQGGDVDGARVVWSELMKRTPEGAPWRADLMQRLAALPPARAVAPASAAPAGMPAPQR